MTALQPGAEEPVHLVVHDQTVDPLAKLAGRIRLGERGEGIAPHVGVAGRRQAEPGQPLARRLYDLGPGGAGLGDVAPDVPASNSANIGASYTTPSSRPSLSRPNAPPGGSGWPSANPASRSAAVFSTHTCNDV